ncbi:MAG: FkbM family methyltransferase [Leptolyngbyaceae cyanobacterium]
MNLASKSKFISYAQNYEDVVLWRALKHVEAGCYIDVGASDPNQASVTKAFYSRGWRGINIEPITKSFEKLCSERPEDTNINAAAGSSNGEIKLFDVVDTGLSTIHKHYAERHLKTSGYDIKELVVPLQTLNSILDSHPISSEIHFLKIDVEGSEKSVLEGLDLNRIRPWIILVEATKPNTQTLDYMEWDSLITEKGYDFCYFDGLNRFYIAKEHSELASSFDVAPNVWDNFITAEQYDLSQKCQQLENSFRSAISDQHKLQQKHHRLEKDFCEAIESLESLSEREIELEAAVYHLTALTHEKELKRQQLEAELHVILHSTSMRATAPFRILVKYLKRLAAPDTFKSKLRLAFKATAKTAIARKTYQRLSPYIPYGVKQKLKRMYFKIDSPVNQTLQGNHQRYLSPIAKQVFHDIKNSIGAGR